MLWGGTQAGIPSRSHVRPGKGPRLFRLLGVYREVEISLQALWRNQLRSNLMKTEDVAQTHP
jgi:hypothetical protein